jgi:PadR family transcriptional regulator, regulatory protein AphA
MRTGRWYWSIIIFRGSHPLFANLGAWREMNYKLIKEGLHTYLECLPGEKRLASEREALDLVAACGENGTDRLMLHAANLTDDFYQLNTGLAGALLLKFSTYRIRVAAILTPALVNQGRFREMVLETNRGNQFRVFYDRKSAEEWLIEG